MRRALLGLLAGVAVAVAITTGNSQAPAVSFTENGKTFTSNAPIYTNPLEPLPSGSQSEPDKTLPHSDTAAFLLLAAVAAVLLAALALWLARILLGIEPRWVSDGRHAFDEAGWRAANTWDEFKDWIRLGR